MAKKQQNSKEQGHVQPRPSAEDVFALLLAQEHAPHGPLKSDLKSAIYVCAATKHYTFEEAVAESKMLLLGMMLASVGYTGDTGDLTVQQILDILQELIDDGALKYVGFGAGFVAPNFVRECVGKVSCVMVPFELTKYIENTFELRFSYEGHEIPLYSKFLVIPGDEVKVVINSCTGYAYVTDITVKRTMLVCEASDYSKGVSVRERGFWAYDVRLAKDGIPFNPGDLVVTEIVSRKGSNVLVVRVREVVQKNGSINSFIYKAVLDHNLPNTWPETVKYQVKSIPSTVSKEETKGRVDLRDLPLVTIDGEDARDFDDAVYCVKEGDKFRLYVAIADVSYYVRSGSAIDNEALNRCTSVYFPFYVIPMLPVELSNGICSLNPNVDRLCMVCEMVINAKGHTEEYEFYPAVMNSHARLTYTEVQHMLATGSAVKSEHQKCVPWVQSLYEVYQALRKYRDERSVFEFESTEVHFLFDRNWKIRGMERDVLDESHKLIEECMIAANICAATFVKENKYESLYRVHERPNQQRLDKLRGILSLYGVELPGGAHPNPRDFKIAAEQVNKLSEGVHQIISLQMLRAMMKARYSPENVGHFGLALENYSHFTSPIRRYPDLQIHRVIKFILEKKKKRTWGKIGSRNYSFEELKVLGDSCSEHEISAADAEYDVTNSLKCEYVKNFINECIEGVVSTVDSYGVFVTLKDFYIDGRLSLNSFIGIDKDQHAFMPYDNSGWIKEGDQVTVRVQFVDSMRRAIELFLVRNKRKSDKDFDVHAVMENLKASAVTNLQPNNDDKEIFFSRIADIFHGKEATNSDFVVRPQRDYTLSDKLDLSKEPAPDASAPAATASVAPVPAAKAPKPVEAKAKAPATAEAKKEKKEKAKPAKAPVAAEKAAPAKAKEPKISPVVEELISEAAANIDADLSGSKKKSKAKKSTDKKAPAKAEPAQAPAPAAPETTVETEAPKAPAKKSTKSKSNAKAKAEPAPEVPAPEATAPEVEAPKAPAKKSSAKKAAAKAAPEAPAAEAPAPEVEAPKAPAKKSTAKKATAKAAPEAPAAEASAPEVEVPKAPVKKSTAKKAAAKVAPEAPAAALAPEVEAPKATAKNSTTKKATAKAAPEAPAAAPASEVEAPKATAKKSSAKKASAKAAPEAPAAEAPAPEAESPKAPAKKISTKKATAKAASEAPAAEAPAPDAESPKAPVKKSTAKKATAKAAPEAPVPEVEAPKAPAKKSTAKKATAKAASEAAAAEAPAPEVEAPKAPAKKSTTKKATAKAVPEAPAAEVPAPEVEAPKAPAKKSTAKKATAKAKVEPATEAPASEIEAPKAPAKKSTTKKATAKAAPESPAAEAPAPEVEAPKAQAKKSTVKKATAKAAPEVPAAEAPAPEVEAPKAPAKKSTAKKATAKAKAEPAADASAPDAEAPKAPAKKSTAKKATAKAKAEAAPEAPAAEVAEAPKAAAKKRTAKKATAKKATKSESSK